MKTKFSLQLPTPIWVKYVVRTLTWLTAMYAILSTQVDLADFGVSKEVEYLILKYMSVLTGAISMTARFIGVEPVKVDTDTPMNKF